MSSLISFLWGESSSGIPNPLVPGQPHSFEVDWVDAKPGETKPRRHIALKGSKELYAGPAELNSLWDSFNYGVRKSGDKNCLGHRQKAVIGSEDVYIWQSYNEVKKRALDIGSALATHDLPVGSIVGIFSINRPEWVITEQALNAWNLVVCPLYDTLGNEAIEYIITQTNMSTVFLTGEKIAAMITLKSKLPALKLLVSYDPVTEEVVKQASEAGVELVYFVHFEKHGSEHKSEPRPAKREDLATICYTSGTTGLPKGVMLSQHALLSAAWSVSYMGQKGYLVYLDDKDVYMSYLPLAHMMERIIVTFFLGVGAAIGFYSGDTAKLLDDIAILRPTLFASVPRLYNRIYDKVQATMEAKGGIVKLLFDTAYSAKKEFLKQGYLTHWLWDSLVFGAVRARLGGRCKAMLSGSAPISPEVQDFMRICFSAEFYEGYGQTENGAGSFLTLRGDNESGTVGVPLPMGEVKLIDIPEMNYTTQDKPFPRGEICHRGYNVMKGYYNNPEKTREDLDEDGWLHTGDIGQFDHLGRLKIIDRKKNIFKLAQGEYVAPEKIENVYQKTKYIAQAFVHGDSLKSYLVGVVVPDEETLLPWCQQNNVPGTTLAEVITNDSVKKLIFDDATKSARANGLKGFELCKALHLHAELFSVQNDLLTPTFKLKRQQAKVVFKQQLDEMMGKIDVEEEAGKKKLVDEK